MVVHVMFSFREHIASMIHSSHQLNALRQRIAPLERLCHPKAGNRVLPFGLEAIDHHLPGCGLALGGLHEVADTGPGIEHASAAGLMVAGILARIQGPVLWATESHDLFVPALAQVGLHPDRVVHVAARKAVLLVMEEGLRHGSFAGIVGEVWRLEATAARRLQLAAESTGVAAFVLRRSRKPQDPTLAAPIPAITRWRITRLPSAPPLPKTPWVPGLAPALWRLDLIRCRGGAPASWIVEACDATGHLHLPAALADRPLAAATEPIRAEERRAG